MTAPTQLISIQLSNNPCPITKGTEINRNRPPSEATWEGNNPCPITKGTEIFDIGVTFDIKIQCNNPCPITKGTEIQVFTVSPHKEFEVTTLAR